MKCLFLFITLLLSSYSFTQADSKIEVEAEITEITFHQGKMVRETAMVKYNLEDGTEQIGSVDLFRIPFIGSMKSVGDIITITYGKDNPFVLQTLTGNFFTKYGMYILIFLGIIFSLKPLLNWKKSVNKQ